MDNTLLERLDAGGLEEQEAAARIRELETQLANQTKRADSYARTAQAVLRDAGPALVTEREKVVELEAQLAEANARAEAAEKKASEAVDIGAKLLADNVNLGKAAKSAEADAARYKTGLEEICAGQFKCGDEHCTAIDVAEDALRPDEQPCPKCGAPLAFVADVEQTGETKQEVAIKSAVCLNCDADEQPAESNE